jgi:hypothetical protein
MGWTNEDSIVDAVGRLWAGQTRNCGSNVILKHNGDE